MSKREAARELAQYYRLTSSQIVAILDLVEITFNSQLTENEEEKKGFILRRKEFDEKQQKIKKRNKDIEDKVSHKFDDL